MKSHQDRTRTHHLPSHGPHGSHITFPPPREQFHVVVGSLNSTASRAACAKDNFTNCRVGNPAAVFDAASGGVVLAYVVRGFGGGVNSEDAIGNGISRSTDGKTWGKPTDVSAGFAGPRLNAGPVAVMPGPGTALVLESGPKKGRLLVPATIHTATITPQSQSPTTAVLRGARLTKPFLAWTRVR